MGHKDRTILAAIRGTAEKHGPVHCIRYRVRVDIFSDADAADLAQEVEKTEMSRLSAFPLAEGCSMKIADHKVLNDLCVDRVWKERRLAVGLICSPTATSPGSC
jgi:hypothetical protein